MYLKFEFNGINKILCSYSVENIQSPNFDYIEIMITSKAFDKDCHGNTIFNYRLSLESQSQVQSYLENSNAENIIWYRSISIPEDKQSIKRFLCPIFLAK